MNTWERSPDIRKECPDKGEECLVSPWGDIYTKNGVYWLNDGNLVFKGWKSFGTFAELERDLAQTLSLERPRYAEETLKKNGFIYYWELQSRWMIPYHNSMTPFYVPTKEQIAAALARTGDKIGDERDT